MYFEYKKYLEYKKENTKKINTKLFYKQKEY